MQTGKQKRRFLLLTLAAVAVLAVIWRSTEDHEPLYHGKPASYWFREYSYRFYGSRGDPDESESLVALQTMGTNALPYLANAAFNTPDYSPLQAGIYKFLQRLPGPLRPAERLDPAETRVVALWAISVMNLPPGALSPLVPSLQQTLQSTNTSVGARLQAAFVLRQMGTTAMPAIPELLNAFSNAPRWQWRYQFAVALCRIDANQTNAFAYLTNGLFAGRPSPSAISLGDIGPNARPAVPALLDLLRGTTNASLLSAVPAALQKIGASPDETLAVLRDKLASAPDAAWLNVCQEILKLNPGDPGIVSNLVARAQSNGAQYWIAIAGLTNAGPAADQAVPHLQELMAGTNMPLRISAFLALKQIQTQKK